MTTLIEDHGYRSSRSARRPVGNPDIDRCDPCLAHAALATPSSEPSVERMPCAIKVGGSIGACLIAGTDYRVAEIREHYEPSGVEGEPPTITTVIRFDPVSSSEPSVEPRLREALEAAGFEPPDNVCQACGHEGGQHDLGNWCLVCPRPEWDHAAKSPTGAKVAAGWCYFASMRPEERWTYGMSRLAAHHPPENPPRQQEAGIDRHPTAGEFAYALMEGKFTEAISLAQEFYRGDRLKETAPDFGLQEFTRGAAHHPPETTGGPPDRSRFTRTGPRCNRRPRFCRICKTTPGRDDRGPPGVSRKRKVRTSLRRCVACGVVRIDPTGWRACPVCPFGAATPVTEAEYVALVRGRRE